MTNALKFLLSVGIVAGSTPLTACSSSAAPSDAASANDAGASMQPVDAGTRQSTDDAGACASTTTCATPPQTKCIDARTARTYSAVGSCLDGACSYLYTDSKCQNGCSGNACNGDDPCNGVVCNSPPSSTCTTPDTLSTYASSGTCSAGSCAYTSSTVTCACDTGACKTYGPASQVDVYDVAACALTSTGKVMCWGSMLYDDIGPQPVLDAAFASLTVTAVSVGDDARCVRTTAGGVKCTGNGAHGALGSSQSGASGIHFSTAYDVDGLSSGVTTVSCANGFCCVRTDAGGAKCWGYNGNGQIGNNTKVDATTAVDVLGLTSNVVSVVTGADHACAVTSSGGVKCWGANDSGQLGNGSTAGSMVPVDVTGLSSGVASISAGYDTTCAVTTSGAVKCWGVTDPGVAHAGWGSLVPASIPTLSSGVASASAGGFLFGSCALSASGGVSCWKYDSATLTPSNVLTSATMVSVGWASGCALTSTGGIRCWGSGDKGQLGNGTNLGSGSAQPVLGFP